MIIGIGTDIIEINRIKKAILNKNFINKVYSQNELEFIKENKYNTFAGNFAAKEAVSKALGTGFSSFMPIDIEILKTENGKPYVILKNNAKKISKMLNIKKIHISISHSIEYAVAFAVAEGE